MNILKKLQKQGAEKQSVCRSLSPPLALCFPPSFSFALLWDSSAYTLLLINWNFFFFTNVNDRADSSGSLNHFSLVG